MENRTRKRPFFFYPDEDRKLDKVDCGVGDQKHPWPQIQF